MSIRNRTLCLIIGLLLLIGMMVPRYDTDIVMLGQTFLPMSADHVLGTDHLGRDVYSLIMAGGVRTLQVVFISSMVSLLMGGITGLIAGYFEGYFETLMQTIMDMIMIIPAFIQALIVSAVIGINPMVIGLVLGIANAGAYFNQVVALTKSEKEKEHVLAARVLGARPIRIMRQHIGPFLLKPVLTLFGNRGSLVTIQYASLSFVGLGTDLTEPDWGALLFQYRVYSIEYPMLIVWPCLAIFMLAVFFQHTFDDYETLDRERGHLYE